VRERRVLMGYFVSVERICFMGWLMSIFTTLSYVHHAFSHTSAYVSILFSIFFIGWLILILTILLASASAYVSVRQRTSGYVRIGGCCVSWQGSCRHTNAVSQSRSLRHTRPISPIYNLCNLELRAMYNIAYSI
jgi:hypothetical protein